MPLLHKFRLIYSLMETPDKRQLLLLGLISVINGLFSVVGIASILPFIGLISEPELLETNRYILMFRDITGIDSYAGVVIAFGSISLFLVVIGNFVSAFDAWYGEVFGIKKEHVLSERLLRNYLQTDVLEFEKKKSAERAKEILSDVERVILDTLFSMFDLFSGIIVSVFVVSLLMLVDWSVTLIVTGALVSFHLLIHQFTSVRLDDLGREYADLEADLYGDVLDALKLQREIKLNGIAGFFVRRYSMSFSRTVRNRLKHSLISLLPQHALEVMAYGVILLIAVYFAVYADSVTAPITMIGMYAFAAYRLMPSIADIFDSVENIWFGSAILENFVKAFGEPDEANNASLDPGSFKKAVSLSDIAFRFSSYGAFHLEHLNVEFSANQLTCIKGKTGCGKSTLLGLLAGLYRPEAGTVCADGSPVDAYGSAQWKGRIGFVPATVNIIQASLYENIALGVALEDIDQQKVRQVSTLVDLDEHVTALKDGYDTIYGESGMSFSSGQIQKVGLARALYRDPELLLLDESTDAFDLNTESLVLERIKALPDITIILVSHRPSAMDHADQIIDLEDVLQRTLG